MARARQIIYNQGEGVSKIELVQPPQSFLTYLQIPLNFYGISKELECIVEDNRLKHGKYLPGMKIPIVGKEKIKTKPDFALVLAWNFIDEIKKKNSNLAREFISIKDLEI